ncbi:MAG: LysR family transcriptional regulator [Roseovarius sp.]
MSVPDTSPHWNDLKTLLYLAQAGSLAGAAQALNVNYTTVARRVTRLEAALGQKLFERLADGYRPTVAGETVAQYAAQMERQSFDLLRALGQQDQSLSGSLVVTAPELLCATFLPPLFDRFCTRHPEVQLEVRAAVDMLDLDRREADLAIRISDTPGDQLKGLRLTTQHTASFATQDWADRIADTPSGVIDWVVFSGLGQVPREAMRRAPGSRVKLMFDDMTAMIGAARAGLGVVRAPTFLGRHYKDLVQVPLLDPQPYADIWAVAHRDVWPTARVAAFRDCLLPYFKEHKASFEA